jgi:archaea-specific RecJ-like exonuclease
MVYDYEPLIKDECSLAMVGPTKKAAQIIEDAAKAQRKILMRFHDDCDGVCSGLLTESALKKLGAKPLMKQGDSAVYSEGDAEYDAERLEGEEKPLLILADHGANSESLKGVARASTFAEVLIIDHHPYHDETVKSASYYLGPFEYGGGSQHCAALLCHAVAQALAGEAEDEYAFYALDSDHSTLSKKKWKEAAVIDYLAITLERPKTRDYLEVIRNPTTVQAYYLRANNAVKAALERARSRARTVHAKGFDAYFVDVGFLEKGGYPSKGKVVNAFQDEHEEEDCVSIAFGDTTALFRVSKGAHQKGFKANELIEKVKARHAHDVFSGGGHEQAASIRFKKGALKKIMGEIESLIQTL